MGALVVPASGGSDWDVIIRKSADQDVIGTVTPQDDNELVTPLAADSNYFIEAFIIYGGASFAADYRCHFTYPTIITIGTSACIGVTTFLSTGASNAVSLGGNTQFPSADILAGTDASLTRLNLRMRWSMTTVGAGNLQFQFAQAALAAGLAVRTYSGSLLRLKKLRP